ncbi:MAG: DUF2608 domain-containing protein [Chlamydiae bacterium]|nr:DUF2608 domain-containing protein [Chlamydiota bacterium]
MHFFLVLVSIFFSSIASAKIIEIQSFKELPSYVNEKTLLLLDIDDTLLIPSHMLGCDEWFNHRIKFYVDQGMDAKLSLEKTLGEWEAIRHLSNMEIVEKGTESILQDLQKDGFTVMGLTTQGVGLSHCTINHLLQNQIELFSSAPFKEPFYFEQKNRGVLFRKGVLFTAGTDKGICLFKLCDHFGYVPQKIVFINDKATHLQEIEAEAAKRGVEFIGLRYGYNDAKKQNFDPKIAEIQFHNSSFQSILTDDHAFEKKIDDILLDSLESEENETP